MKQHYVPRCYLRQFSDNPKSIYTYDKVCSKSYRASLMSVCCEEDMYSLSDSYIKDCNENNGGNLNKLSIEHEHFSDFVEPNLSKLLKDIDVIKNEWMTDKDHYRLSFFEKKEIALHLVTQFFRLPDLKKATVDDYLRLDRASVDMFKHILAKQYNDESFEKLKIDFKCEEPALHANLTYLDTDILMSFADVIANNIWIFQVSQNADFYTSDFPIVVVPHVKAARPLYMGLAQYGGELTYPISPSLLLTVFDRKYFASMVGDDGVFVKAVDKEVRRQNIVRYLYAKRHVFSYRNDFGLIDFMLKLNGKHIFYKANFNSTIVSGLGKY